MFSLVCACVCIVFYFTFECKFIFRVNLQTLSVLFLLFFLFGSSIGFFGVVERNAVHRLCLHSLALCLQIVLNMTRDDYLTSNATLQRRMMSIAAVTLMLTIHHPIWR